MKKREPSGLRNISFASPSLDELINRLHLTKSLIDKIRLEKVIYLKTRLMTEKYLIDVHKIFRNHFDHDLLRDVIVEQALDLFLKKHLSNAKCSTLLYYIARNKVIDYWRNKYFHIHRRSIELQDYDILQSSPEDNYLDSTIRGETAMEIKLAIKTLSTTDQQIVNLIYYKDIKEKDVCNLLHIKDYNLSKKKKQILTKLSDIINN